MVVNEDDRGGIMIERAAEDRPWINGELGQRALLQLFVGDQSVPGIEKQHAEHFVRQRTHGGNQIAAQRRVERVDANRAKARPHPFEHGIAHDREKGLNFGPIGEDMRQAFGGLRPEASKLLELRQQLCRYLFACDWLDEPQERYQDRSVPLVRSRIWCRQVAKASRGGRSQAAATCIVR